MEGEYRLEFSIAKIRNFDENDINDNFLYEFTFLFQLPVNKIHKASQIITKVIQFAKSDLNITLDPLKIRLRER